MAAAQGSPRPGEAIARVATIGYTGFLAGRPFDRAARRPRRTRMGAGCRLPRTLGVVLLPDAPVRQTPLLSDPLPCGQLTVTEGSSGLR